ncbi:shikimate kinase [Brumimicrobium salinarum]|uniref:Shikimate kinase n=1 Tax=Brumimicrobium salinarum TaxID=2058658 RepID=A0A2I0R584_9FLAO|nr:shikimate kinase [Brumimicrobium salinarum]PKR81738.1 shikimate kinase [Brumimicrobium salinarum]
MDAKNIFFIGFMGAGKTTLAKKLANRLNREFIDTDKEIEKTWNMSIPQIFSEHGELFFRTQESLLLNQLIKKKQNSIISVGGGLPCHNNNMKLMNDNGLTFYLKRPTKELFQRLRNVKQSRPLIQALSDSELSAFIEDKIKERSVFYEGAKVILTREQQNVKSLAELLSKL